MKKDEIINIKKKIKGAHVEVRDDIYASEKYMYVECEILDYKSFFESAPEFLLIMIENEKMRQSIMFYNSNGIGFKIGRSVEIDE